MAGLFTPPIFILLKVHFQTSVTICAPQSLHRMRTSLVALTEVLQQGHTYFRVLLGFAGVRVPVVLLPPLPVGTAMRTISLR